MAKKQTRRSISVSRSTYERLKAFCETQGISMSQFVETRVGDFLSESDVEVDGARPEAPRPAPVKQAAPPRPVAPSAPPGPKAAAPAPTPAPVRAPGPVMMSAAAARFAVEPPLPIIKPRGEPADVKPPTVPTADQIFTF